MAPSRHDCKIVDWDVKPQPKQTNTKCTCSQIADWWDKPSSYSTIIYVEAVSKTIHLSYSYLVNARMLKNYLCNLRCNKDELYRWLVICYFNSWKIHEMIQKKKSFFHGRYILLYPDLKESIKMAYHC